MEHSNCTNLNDFIKIQIPKLELSVDFFISVNADLYSDKEESFLVNKKIFIYFHKRAT